MDNIREMLDEEIRHMIEVLSSNELGSEERRKAIDDLTYLHKLRVEEVKLEQEEVKERNDDVRKSHDNDLRWGQLDEQTKDRLFRIGVDVAGIVIPLVFYGVWMNRGFKFEENGTFTSTTFRGLFGRFRPTR